MLRKMPAPVTKSLALAILMQVVSPGFAVDIQAESQPAGGVTAEKSPEQEEDFDWDWSGVTADDATPAEVARKPTVPVQTPGTGATTTAEPDYSASPEPAIAIFANAPEFDVIPSKRNPGMHPCSNCHQWTKSNATPRLLNQPHDDLELKHGLHGKGSFWCMTCHHLDGPGGLVTLEGEKVEFNDAYLICSQCHVQQAKDWVYGAHGKRIGNWQGRRRILNCTACHYQHRPALKPRVPKAGPVVRMGLERPSHWKPLEGDSGHKGHNLHYQWQTHSRQDQAAGNVPKPFSPQDAKAIEMAQTHPTPIPEADGDE